MTAVAAAALAFALAGAGYAARWLTADGALAAGAVGAAVLSGSGIAGASVLALFFVSGSVLSAVNSRGSAGSARRNARQVLANGTWAAIGALFLLQESSLGWSILVGSLAAAQSDTWATETGRWSPGAPRMLTTGARVEAGTSGGITPLGTAGGVAGAMILSGVASYAGVPGRVALASAGAGIIGMLADSFLGATVQGRFRCDACGVTGETRTCRNGHAGVLVRGWKWLDNDGVNFLACAAGAAAAVALGPWH